MNRVAYASPFVPAEWIVAHQLRSVWLPGLKPPSTAAGRGKCRCAQLLVELEREPLGVDALVLTTICDQMRYAAASRETTGGLPVFLLNVPSTWQTREVRQLYREELIRLGRFLESLGGCAPSAEHLMLTMQRYDEARARARTNWPETSHASYAARLGELRDAGAWSLDERDGELSKGGVPLAVVGGPLLGDDFVFYERIAAAGGRVVLDASEWGERTLPVALDPAGVTKDPLGELVRIYFGEIPDVFRRPNTHLYDWLGRQLTQRNVQGILFWRRLSCDLWHAEVEVMRQWSPVPLLDLDMAEGVDQGAARNVGRMEAFLEVLR